MVLWISSPKEAITTHVEKYEILSRVFDIAADETLAFRDPPSGWWMT